MASIDHHSPVILAHETPFEMGPVMVYPATRELKAVDRTLILEPRVMQALVALHRIHGSVLSKDDLVIQCWDGRIVGDDAINRVMSRLREAAAQTGNVFRIETITRVGYRLIEGSGPGGKVSSGPWNVVSRRQAVAAGAAVALAGTAGTAWLAGKRESMPPAAAALMEQGNAAMLVGTIDQYANAAGMFRAASRIAPDRAEVWGALARAYARQADLSSSEQREMLLPRSRAAADRALAIDPTNGDALAARVLTTQLFGNWAAFERTAKQALSIKPRHAMLNSTFAFFLTQVGRNRAALAFVDRAIETEPNAPRAHYLRAMILWDIGRLEEAEATIEQARKLWPSQYALWFGQYNFLAYTGRASDAVAMIADTANRPTGIPSWNFDLTAKQAQAAASRDPAVIDQAVALWVETARRGTGFAESAMMFAGAMGRVDQAFRVIDAYYFNRGFAVEEQRFSREQGMYSTPKRRHTFQLFGPLMRSIRRDPRFGALVDKLGLTDYWRRSGFRPDYQA